MIVTKFYKGQGLGNQLWVYSVLRSLAWKNHLDFGIESFKNYKLPNYLPIDPGKRVYSLPHERPYGLITLQTSKVLFENQIFMKSHELAISHWESRIAEVGDKTKLEGYFQSLWYIGEFRDKFQKMLQVQSKVTQDPSICYISVRGGDFRGHPEICCDRSYYEFAINEMRQNGFTSFRIVTDDIEYARSLLPRIEIASFDVGRQPFEDRFPVTEEKVAHDFALLQNAKGLILSNSTFAWWAAWTNLNDPIVIAPRYWSHPRSCCKLWAPREIAVSEWKYCDGTETISGSDAVLECQQQAINSNYLTKTIKSNLNVKSRLKNSLYKWYLRLQNR